VSATLIDGTAVAATVKEEVAAAAAELGGVKLATILVGDDPASHLYIDLKHRDCHAVGIESDDRRLRADTTQEELLEVVRELNEDDTVDGLLVQLPLPAHLDEAAAIAALDPAKDVDGLHPVNQGLLLLGRPRLVGATPAGVMRLLDEYRVQVAGKRAVVIGRSRIVGKPMALLLLQANATVSICHSQTVDMARLTTDADILVAAVGVAHLVSPDMVKAGAAVIDVGMNRTEDGLFGDVDPGAAEVAGFMTPVPGGVGPMTRAMLLVNAVAAGRARRAPLASRGH
jgi:methylenetetrahydrofolate dehydrogenase (NADP+) / methenyltetrahydrofolate cyclohydrolase